MSDADDDDAPPQEDELAIEPDGAVSVGPDAAALAEIDELLAAKDVAQADALLSPLRDEFPGDAQLAWRQGKVLALSKRKEAPALAAYSAALELDPALLEDETFVAELHALMRNPKVRDEALDLALQHMGRHGHAFLLEQVNDDRKPLGFTDRKRALAELAKDPANEGSINAPLNIALDVLQALDSRTPCVAYRGALESIAAAPDYYYVARIERAKVPEPPADAAASPEEANACEGLVERRAEVLALLAPLAPPEPPPSETPPEAVEPQEPAPKSPPPRKSTRKPKKASTAKKANCKKFGSMLKKECWKKR